MITHHIHTKPLLYAFFKEATYLLTIAMYATIRLEVLNMMRFFRDKYIQRSSLTLF